MEWKKISSSKDFLSFEKKTKSIKVRIEARLEKKVWRVYKTYYDEKSIRFVEEFTAGDNKKLEYLLEELKKEKILSKSLILKKRKERKTKLNVHLKRAYKEYEFEKWTFGFKDDTKDNVIIIHYGEFIEIDLMMNDKYRHLYREVLDQLFASLGIEDQDKKINVYYYNFQFQENELKKKPSVVFGKIELGMGGPDDKS